MDVLHPRTAPADRRPVALGVAVVSLVVAFLSLIALTAETSMAAKARAATVTAAAPKVSAVTDSSAKLRVSGTVKLPSNLRSTAKNRNKVRVAVTLQDAKKKAQSFTVKIDSKRKYAVTRTTKLRGALTVKVQARVSGKPSGKVVTRKVTVRTSGSTGGGSSTVGGSGASSGGGAAGGSASTPIPPGAEKLVGLFRLAPGEQQISGTVSGSYFRMIDPSGRNGLSNADSPLTNKQLTPLRPGTDGGLRTDGYQGPPVPAFANGDLGDALANRIIQPQRFYQTNFSIAVAPTDPQLLVPVPLVEIHHRDGQLSGQTTGWVAQWNGQSFNQGVPKPDGGLPGFSAPVSGTYDATTRAFRLTWKSLIVGGPFNGFTGDWHLAGTFEPAA